MERGRLVTSPHLHPSSPRARSRKERWKEVRVQPRSGDRAALHLNDDKSLEALKTPVESDERGKGGFNDPLTARQADAGQTGASPRSFEEGGI